MVNRAKQQQREAARAPPRDDAVADRYLLRFVLEAHTDRFRYLELDALLRSAGLDPTSCYDRPSAAAAAGEEPYVVLRAPSPRLLRDVVTRAILVRDALEIWGVGADHGACAAHAAALEGTDVFFGEETTWCLGVEAYGVGLDLGAQEAVRNQYRDAFRCRGRVRLKGADVRYRVVEVYDEARPAKGAAPARCYAGRVVAASRARELVSKLDLKQRLYLGPTALDAELALIMANAAGVREGCYSLDAFAGTGSILVACAALGGRCLGSDIDWKVLRGKHVSERDSGERRRGALPRKQPSAALQPLHADDKERRTIFANFRQYGLPLPEILRMDSSRFFDSFRGPSIEGAFDCVVSDPPYGVRAGARCAGKDGAVKPVPDELRREHVPATKPYATADVLCDLLEIAARCLKQGGRLAYLLPATNDLTPEDVPRHPALTLVACEPQQLSTKYARWLVVMVKGRDWSARDWTPAVRAGVRRGADAPFAALKEKLALPPAPPPAPKR
jgi:tRNA (guanine10-N2)-methyltransferase